MNFLCAKMLFMLEDTIQTIPPASGSYLLWLQLSQSQNLTVGKLGEFTFPAGDYVYLGSARGPGGLRARLGRHLRGDGKTRWHIDYLRAAAQLRGYGFVIHHRGMMYRAPMECDWSQKLATLPKSRIVALGFGASDCQSGCAAHLICFPKLQVDQIATLLNCEIRIQSFE